MWLRFKSFDKLKEKKPQLKFCKILRVISTQPTPCSSFGSVTNCKTIINCKLLFVSWKWNAKEFRGNT